MNGSRRIPSAASSARHICEEARVVLSYVRAGPPAVAHGDLAENLIYLRRLTKSTFLEAQSSVFTDNDTAASEDMINKGINDAEELLLDCSSSPTKRKSYPPFGQAQPPHSPMTPRANSNKTKTDAAIDEVILPFDNIITMRSKDATDANMGSNNNNNNEVLEEDDDDVGRFAFPFLAVVMDPRAAGPQTLVAVRALHRLMQQKSLLPKRRRTSKQHLYCASMDAVTRGVLRCKFEQTDAGADEAVEMAIADFYSFILRLDASFDHELDPTVLRLKPSTRMEAFKTVFVNRNTWVHSPALCYHFDTVLTDAILSSFQFGIAGDKNALFLETFRRQEVAARPILEFLVQQLLHTPMAIQSTFTNGRGVGAVSRNYAISEAQAVHDATRVLCLRLIRSALQTGWGASNLVSDVLLTHSSSTNMTASVPRADSSSRSCFDIIQDDLCLSLLLTGQQLVGNGASVKVLSEVCATISCIWNLKALRSALPLQLETIFNGFFQRTLAMLRQRPPPTDSFIFNSNLLFDTECEVVLETLLDILCLHDTDSSSSVSSLEELFVTYDCSVSRSDVASGLIQELCRCSGAPLDINGAGATSIPRQVPAHLRELCSEALVGCLRNLFKNLQDSQISHEPTVLSTTSSVLRRQKDLKNTLRTGASLFNQKPTAGIQFLSTEGVFPTPLRPKDVALFLRQGLALGIDKSAVGMYLGEVGKAPIAGKSPHDCERDWFHHDTLVEYCSLFHFESQSILGCLRMFLSSFRLPGEAQQIDRILQAFAESCCRQCNESTQLKYLSNDPKKAADAAYLLAFSIILLNTDLHNTNIRPDRKMTLDAFVMNNTNYGRDITEEGKEIPRDFLEGIYNSIKEEEIRTEGEGAEGMMTVERWRDVIRSTHVLSKESTFTSNNFCLRDQLHQASEVQVLKNLVLEMCLEPYLTAVGSFWEVVDSGFAGHKVNEGSGSGSGMLGAECARLGMDLAIELLAGSRLLARKDLFAQVFSVVCLYTGLLQYEKDNYERTLHFIYSVQKQSAFIVAMNCSKDFVEYLGQAEWKMIWSMVFEMRDLKLLGIQGGGLLVESDPDLLTKHSRMEFTTSLMNDDMGDSAYYGGVDYRTGLGGLFGSMGKMFFGDERQEQRSRNFGVGSMHRKEALILWNELSPSDDEEEGSASDSIGSPFFDHDGEVGANVGSPGAIFESQLIHEDHVVFVEAPQQSMSVSFLSPRGRVRRRLAAMCDFYGLVADSRFLSLDGIQASLSALVEILGAAHGKITFSTNSSLTQSLVTSEGNMKEDFIISPASEALAEVLICEIALKNRDRIKLIWEFLRLHYQTRLGFTNSSFDDTVTGHSDKTHSETVIGAGIEKCATGLIRICICMSQRAQVVNDILPSLKFLYFSPLLRTCNGLDKHLGEGLWRICRNVDGLKALSGESWDAVLGLAEFCASKGGHVIQAGPGRGGLAEDDPALNAYRSFHIMLSTAELKFLVPFSIVRGVRSLILSGERGNCAKLSIASLDILYTLHVLFKQRAEEEPTATIEYCDSWVYWWISVIEGMAEAGKTSQSGAVRMHALAMLTDAVTDRQGAAVAPWQLYTIVQNTCVCVAGFRINALLKCEDIGEFEEIMIELELCISLVFKPLLHYLKTLVQVEDKFPILWESVLHVMEQLLGDETLSSASHEASDKLLVVRRNSLTRENLLTTTKELGSEHLRNAVMVLMSYGIIDDEASSPSKTHDLSALTWNTIRSMSFCSVSVEEWKQSGKEVCRSESLVVTDRVSADKGDA